MVRYDIKPVRKQNYRRNVNAKPLRCKGRKVILSPRERKAFRLSPFFFYIQLKDDYICIPDGFFGSNDEILV